MTMTRTPFLALAAATLALPLVAQPVFAQTAPTGAAPADHYTGVPPQSAYRGGAGSPYSPGASNIVPGDTHSEIAPRLPNPDAEGNGARAYLVAARSALARHNTGAAQEALERAETRILTRSTVPAMANTPDQSGMARAITEARLALGHREPQRAMQILDDVLTRTP